MKQIFTINNTLIGRTQPVYIIAEISANHNQDLQQAKDLIEMAKVAGSNAVKIQTYTPDTMTLPSREFRHTIDSPWREYSLYELYEKAYLPWDFIPELKEHADKNEIDFISSVYDKTSIDFLEENAGVAAYKIASYELIDLPLLSYAATKNKPIIASTGMANATELWQAYTALRDSGCRELALLHCISKYPAEYKDLKLLSIGELYRNFYVPVGFSDHSEGVLAPIVATALGANIVEKHFYSAKHGGLDKDVSLSSREFEGMVIAIRETEKTFDAINFASVFDNAERDLGEDTAKRRSLYVVADIKQGEEFTEDNVKSLRPALGLPPQRLFDILGKEAAEDIPTGTPLKEAHIAS